MLCNRQRFFPFSLVNTVLLTVFTNLFWAACARFGSLLEQLQHMSFSRYYFKSPMRTHISVAKLAKEKVILFPTLATIVKSQYVPKRWSISTVILIHNPLMFSAHCEMHGIDMALSASLAIFEHSTAQKLKMCLISCY